MEKKTDRVQQGLDRMLSQYEEVESTTSMVEATILDSQDSEDTGFDCLLDRWLDTAEGVQLTRYGEDLNVFRQGLTDEPYRTLIKATIVRYQSSGKFARVVEAFKLIAGVTDVQLQEYFPAAFTLHGTLIGDDVTSDPATIADTMRNAKAAGVGIEHIAVGKGPTFAYAGFPGDASGYADIDIPGTGGYYVTIRDDLIPARYFGYAGAPGNVGGYRLITPYSPLNGGKYRQLD